MTNMHEEFPDELGHEISPNQALADFLFDQFQEAAQRRVRDMGRTAVRRGSPIGHVIDTGEASVLAGTEGIVIKPPHPNDSRGDYAEAFAYVSPTPTELFLDYGNRKIYLTGTYRLKLHGPNPENDEVWLVDSNGSYEVPEDAARALANDEVSELRAVVNSGHIYDIVSGYSPVFVAGEQPPKIA